MRMLACFSAALLASVWCHAASGMTCTIGSVSGLSFGDYDVFAGTPLDTSGSFSYTCTDVAGGSIVVHLSTGSAGTYSPRTLVSGAFVLEYNLYLDAARTSIWGDNTSGTSQYGPLTPGEGEATPVNVYGRVPAGQNARVGSYEDTVVVTIIF